MSISPRRIVSSNKALAVLSSWALILLAPVVFAVAVLAVTVTFVIPVVLVLAILIPFVLFLAPILHICRSWSGWSWVGSALWCPWLWSWLWQSWWQWPWLCWKWLR